MSGWLLWSAAAFAGGGGSYLDFSGGAGWSDVTGPLVRGSAGGIATGLYFGDYHGTFRYGRYWRLGLWLRYIDTYYNRNELIDSIVIPGVELGRGVDLMNLGAFWSVALGGALVEPKLDEPILWGPAVRGSVGGMYNAGSWFALTLRFEGGLQLLESDVSLAGGFAIGVLFRAPVVRTRWKRAAAEREVVDVRFADLFPPVVPEPVAEPDPVPTTEEAPNR